MINVCTLRHISSKNFFVNWRKDWKQCTWTIWLTERSQNHCRLYKTVTAGALCIQLPGGFWGRKNWFMGEAVQIKVLLKQGFFVSAPFLCDKQIKKKNCQNTKRSTRKVTVQIGKVQGCLLDLETGGRTIGSCIQHFFFSLLFTGPPMQI